MSAACSVSPDGLRLPPVLLRHVFRCGCALRWLGRREPLAALLCCAVVGVGRVGWWCVLALVPWLPCQVVKLCPFSCRPSAFVTVTLSVVFDSSPLIARLTHVSRRLDKFLGLQIIVDFWGISGGRLAGRSVWASPMASAVGFRLASLGCLRPSVGCPHVRGTGAILKEDPFPPITPYFSIKRIFYNLRDKKERKSGKRKAKNA